ncbi:hypothetical protein HPB47_024906 [Ixodes persulcatus]|uniref:Uncharacterized protein n=1 Tax=Ixodes persulcatus TaxID=34615 RepID=A0AC60Q371_IXOPE|nr:hypothetical protein HPB47_024906 [Ixodes persulcatus]
MSALPENVSFEYYVAIDDGVLVCGQLTDDEIIASVQRLEGQEDDSCESDAEEPPPRPSPAEASTALDVLANFTTFEDTDGTIMKKPDPINVRQAAEMLTGAWWTVKPATIVNGWEKAGLSAASWTTVDANLEEEEQDTDGESSEPDGWKELSERLGADSPLPFEDYAASDSQIETCATLTTEEIVASALPQEEEEEAYVVTYVVTRF